MERKVQLQHRKMLVRLRMAKYLVGVLTACSEHTEASPLAPARKRRPTLLVTIPCALLGCCIGASLLGPRQIQHFITVWDNRLWRGYAHYFQIFERMNNSSIGSSIFPPSYLLQSPCSRNLQNERPGPLLTFPNVAWPLILQVFTAGSLQRIGWESAWQSAA